MMSYGAGDAEAFEILYQRYKTPLYRFVFGQCDKELADELFQDVWLKVINNRHQYKVTASFKTWLYQVARNRIIDQYRRKSIRPVDNNIDTLDSVESTAVVSPEKNLQTQTQYEVLLDAITELPTDQKQAFLLREEAGLSIEQIAETCGVNFETAKSRLRYAIKKLRQKIGESE